MSCYAPFYVDNPSFPLVSSIRQVPVPCGKCPPCLKRRSDAWGFRLSKEENVHTNSSFITLTYDNNHVPMTEKNYMTLCKKDFQDFMKRLRKYHSKSIKIKYWACGEYGSTTFRPHYHAIIFNLDREKLTKAWTLGTVHIGDVSGASIAYTTKYMNKGRRIPLHKNDDRLPEFSLMSKKLGSNYLTDDIIKYHQEDITRNYLTLEGGVKIAMPRYYREKIYSEKQRKQQSMTIEESQKLAQRKFEERYKNRTGSLENIDYSKFQSIKHHIEEFKQTTLNNRSKI